MDFQSLCEIADRELNVGLADTKLVERAMTEANGVGAQARQLFWQLRAQQLQKLQHEAIETLVSNIAARENQLRSRKESYRWFWALGCVAGILGATIFPWFAFAAIAKAGPWFPIFLVLSAASLALAIVAYIASRYHTHTG